VWVINSWVERRERSAPAALSMTFPPLFFSVLLLRLKVAA
jgi:hypothetical protein